MDSNLENALEHFAKKTEILIALDFDGTLAPLVDDPEASQMLPGARAALDQAVERPGVAIALVTGRAIDSLVRVAKPDPRWWLVGSHGGEVVPPGTLEQHSAAPEVDGELIAAFHELVGEHPKTFIEIKPQGIAFHTRGLAPDAAARAEAAAWEMCEGWPAPLTLRRGHGLVECSVRSATKGDGLVALKEAIRPEATLFIGDDRTDEDGFAVLGDGDLAIRCGGGETIAPFALDNADAVAEFLTRLVALRSQK